MRTFDFAPFRRSTVGFDRLFDLLESGPPSQGAEGYPPFDLEHNGEDRYRITLAVAGFSQDDIEITTQQNLLLVAGEKRGEDRGDFVHRGIAARSFERRFVLGDFVQVKKAELRDGLLSIELEREIPEAMKPRRVPVSASTQPDQIEARRSESEAAEGKLERA